MTSEFICYLHEPDVHDGTILRVKQNATEAHVLVKTYEGQLWGFEFSNVDSVKQFEPEGMLLYSISEMTAPAPLRRFVFGNWNEDEENALEIVARDVASRKIANEAEF